MFIVQVSRNECAGWMACTRRQAGLPECGRHTGCIRKLERNPTRSGADWRVKRKTGTHGKKEQEDPSKDCFAILVAMRLGETPVPIPNTMVKT